MIFFFTLLGYGIGKIIGNLFVGNSEPSWSSYLLPTPPKKIDDIVYFQLSSTSNSEDPTGESLYVRTVNGDFYSYTLFQSDWISVDTDPTHWENPYVSKCAAEWFGPSDFFQLEAYPPVEKEVIDSAGVSFWKYPSTSIARCYTLLDNGNIQVWTYSGNAKNLIKNRFLKKSFAGIGIFTGIILSIIILYKKRKTGLVAT
jgi:hypothetical protein